MDEDLKKRDVGSGGIHMRIGTVPVRLLSGLTGALF